METERKGCGGHVVAIPWPSTGHMNPILQLCKRLVSNGLKVTLVIPNRLSGSLDLKLDSIDIDTISDGYDQGGWFVTDSPHDCFERFKAVGSLSLTQLINKYEVSGHPVHCVLYDSFLPWVLPVAKKFGLIAAPFCTQMCSVNFVNYHVYHGFIPYPVAVSIPGLPYLDLPDLPGFSGDTYKDGHEVTLSQFSTMDNADIVLVNTFYKLEEEPVEAMSKVHPFMLTIGPTVPSFYLDNRVENDNNYGIQPSDLDPSSCLKWLNSKPAGSVVYVSFGTINTSSPGLNQTEEIALGLKASNCNFLWVVREPDEHKLPKNFAEETSEKGLIVRWSPQLEVLSNEAVGCFFSHCGWNSTCEALSFGVPVIAMPTWADQTTDAKFIQDVWKMGIRVKVDEEGMVGREEVERCVREILEGEGGKDMKKNATEWSRLAKEAISEGGTSDQNINQFISKVTNHNNS